MSLSESYSAARLFGIPGAEIVRVRVAALPGRDEDADRDGNVLLVNQILQHLRHAQRPGRVGGALPVLKHEHVGGRRARVLRRHVDPVAAHRAGDDLALEQERPFELPLRHTVLRQRIRAERIRAGLARAARRRLRRLRGDRVRYERGPARPCANAEDRRKHTRTCGRHTSKSFTRRGFAPRDSPLTGDSDHGGPFAPTPLARLLALARSRRL